MGVYIKGMEMPKSCGVCPFCVPEADEDNGDICVLCGQFPLIKQERSIECPLIPVPPHGRLIDADALRESFRESIEECHKWADEMRESENEEMVIRAEQSLGTFVECSLRAKNAPTIIEAKEGE